MDNLSVRLFLYFFIGLFLGGFSVFSFAAAPISAEWPSYSQYPSVSRSAAFSCGGSISGGDTKFDFDLGEYTGSGDGGRIQAGDNPYAHSGPSYYGWFDGKTEHTCVVYTAKPYCPVGYKWDGADLCIPDDDKCKPMKGLKFGSGYVAEAANKINMSFPKTPDDNYEGVSTACQSQCLGVVSKDYGGATYDGRYYGTFEITFTGTSCPIEKPDTSPTSTPEKSFPKDSEEKKCIDAGKAFGYVNENVMCVDGETKKGTAGKTTTTSTPDGGKKEVKTDTTVKCDGSVCITTTETTTTTINSSGTVTGTTKDTKTETTPDGGGTGGGGVKESSFCKENPSSPMCKEGAFSATCDAEPKCSGDAVFCATAKATWQTKCALDASSEVKAAGTSVLVEGGDDKAKEALKRNDKDVSELVTPESSSSGGCVPDRTVSFGSTTIVVPFSSLCGAMAMMRVVLLAIAGMTAAFIIIGGVK